MPKGFTQTLCTLTIEDWHAIDRALLTAASAYRQDAEALRALKGQSAGNLKLADSFAAEEKRCRALVDIVGQSKWDWATP